MAKVEALHAGSDEGLMLNEQGYVAECTGDNIFVIRRGPDHDASRVVRGAAWDYAGHHFCDRGGARVRPVVEELLTRYEDFHGRRVLF